MRLAVILLLAAAGAQGQFRLVQTIPLPGVKGRIDHLAADVAGRRLFVAALGNNTVEVVDLAAGRRLHSLGGFSEPQGLLYVPELQRLFVAKGGDGRCAIFEGGALAPAGGERFPGDADNLRYAAAPKRVWVGFGDGALGEMDAATGKLLGRVRLDAHPESFQLESGGQRIFVNVPNAEHVAVVDPERRVVVARWALPGAAANFPMALDEETGRLFVACRRPPEVLVLDTGTGRTLARFACPGDADDLFYDAARRRIYVSGGGGAVAAFQRKERDYFQPLGSTSTAPGARTSLWVAALNRLYIAVPRGGAQEAEVRVYEPE
jgi:DNA-binding beta-propeller fold protein YncE